MGKKKRPLWLALALALLAGMALLLYFICNVVIESRRLPPIGEIEAMSAIYGEMNERFSIPREKWPEILDALAPAKQDNQPAKWQEMGLLYITKRSGRPVIVGLFTLPKGPGAFRIEAIGGPVYYRGGDSARLSAALQTAYELSRDR
jgi:hypothetical protein